MHDLIRSKNYSVIPKDEMMKDLEEEMKKLEANFKTLFDQ